MAVLQRVHEHHEADRADPEEGDQHHIVHHCAVLSQEGRWYGRGLATHELWVIPGVNSMDRFPGTRWEDRLLARDARPGSALAFRLRQSRDQKRGA